MSKIGDQRISRPPVYHLVSDVADAINSIHVMQQCEKSAYFATSLTAEHSKVRRGAMRSRPTPPLLSYAACDVSHVPAMPMSVICLARAQHGTHYTPFPSVRSSCCSTLSSLRTLSNLRRPTWCVSDPRGQSPLYRAKCPSVPSSADIICITKELVAHMLTYCDPHISRPPNFEGGKTVPNFSTCIRVRTVVRLVGWVRLRLGILGSRLALV